MLFWPTLPPLYVISLPRRGARRHVYAAWLALLVLGAGLGARGVRAADVTLPAATAARVASVFLEDLTWTELREAIAHGTTTALLPIGGTEQSGPALALGKHNARVRYLSARIAQSLGNAIVAPVVAYVPEGNIAPPSGHMRFPGTLTVPPAAFEANLESIVRSLRAAGFRDIVLLGDHGGYQHQLAQLATRLGREWLHTPVRVYAPAAYYRASSEGFARILREHGFGDDEIGTHAALADTALQLAVDARMVRQEVLDASAPLDSRVGVLGGNPRRASAAMGQLGLDEIVRQTVAAVRADIAAARPPGPAAH